MNATPAVIELIRVECGVERAPGILLDRTHYRPDIRFVLMQRTKQVRCWHVSDIVFVTSFSRRSLRERLKVVLEFATVALLLINVVVSGLLLAKSMWSAE